MHTCAPFSLSSLFVTHDFYRACTAGFPTSWHNRLVNAATRSTRPRRKHNEHPTTATQRRLHGPRTGPLLWHRLHACTRSREREIVPRVYLVPRSGRTPLLGGGGNSTHRGGVSPPQGDDNPPGGGGPTPPQRMINHLGGGGCCPPASLSCTRCDL